MTRAQLFALGLSDASDRGADAQRGALIRVHRGVYAVGHLPTRSRSTEPAERCSQRAPRSALMRRSAGGLLEASIDALGYPLRADQPAAAAYPGPVRCTAARTLASTRHPHPRRRPSHAAPRARCSISRLSTHERTAPPLPQRTADAQADHQRAAPRCRATATRIHAGRAGLRQLAGASHRRSEALNARDRLAALRQALQAPAVRDERARRTVSASTFCSPRTGSIVELDGWDTHGTRHAFESRPWTATQRSLASDRHPDDAHHPRGPSAAQPRQAGARITADPRARR